MCGHGGGSLRVGDIGEMKKYWGPRARDLVGSKGRGMKGWVDPGGCRRWGCEVALEMGTCA